MTRTKTKKILVLLVGWGFLVLGVIGLFLPVLQGIAFILIGLIILSSEYVWAHKLLQKLRNRFPSAARHAEDAAQRTRDWLGKRFHRVKEPAP